MRLALAICALLVTSPLATAAEVIKTHATDGECQRLVISGEDVTAQCGTALAVLVYDDGRVAVSAGTGGQAFFGLADPERMLLFIGSGEPWTDFIIDQVVTGPADPHVVPISGACSHADADPGLIITCDATDAAGLGYALTYRTDGGPAFSF